MKVKHILKQKGYEYFSIRPDCLLTEAVEKMMQEQIGALVVTEEDSLISIITERDIMRAIDTYRNDFSKVLVKTMMAEQVITCKSEDTVDRAMDLMTNNPTGRRLRHLPVIEDKLVGVISIGDIVEMLLTETKFENRLLKNFIKNWPEDD